jgi:metal-responsive CopG/Arc/MetJ family transcriptional regulator
MNHQPLTIVALKLRRDLLDAVDKVAREQHRSRSDVIRQALLKELRPTVKAA